MHRQLVLSMLLAAAGCSCAVNASAASPGSASPIARTTDGGVVYATGAVSNEDLQAVAGEKGRYNLWVTTAARGSGAYLSDAQVKICDAADAVVLETMMVGPWLFVDLPAGSYRIETTFEGRTQQRTLRVGGNRTQQVIVYFDTPAALSPEWRSPFADSPYASR